MQCRLDPPMGVRADWVVVLRGPLRRGVGRGDVMGQQLRAAAQGL
jgi:hypothetical protein